MPEEVKRCKKIGHLSLKLVTKCKFIVDIGKYRYHKNHSEIIIAFYCFLSISSGHSFDP